MDVIDIANEIQAKIKVIADARTKLKQKGEAKAKAISDYDKAIALTILKLKNNKIIKFEDEEINNLSVTLIEKVAKGICYQEKLNLEIAESDYKSLLSFIDCVSTEINALQSINRHLDKA